MSSLPNVRAGLLHHSLDGQVLVYDPREDRVHLLDPTTACVMELLQDGRKSEAEIIAEVANQLKVTPDLMIVQLAIEQLREAELLEPGDQNVQKEGTISRRDILRKLAAAGVAGVLIPTISTLTASRAYAQGTVLGVGSACVASADCLQGTGRCCGGRCFTAACTASNGACGAGVTPGSGNTVPDCSCCSGSCHQSGASAPKCT